MDYRCWQILGIQNAGRDVYITRWEQRFGHEDFETYLGLSHRKIEIPVKRNFKDGQKHFFREILPDTTVFDEYGIGHSKGSEFAFHMTRMHHPLRGADINEILNYPYPNVDESQINDFNQKVADIHAKGLASFGFMQMTVWEASWYLRSMEELMIDMMMENEAATILFDKITDFACSKARAYATAGIDILSLGDDIGTQSSLMIDVGLWEQWLQPRLKKVALSRLEKCGPKGGIVIGPTHIVEPEVPWDNLIAIIEAANEYESKINPVK